MIRIDVPVLVVGGGPAGAATALLLARAGWCVELAERGRFPRGKACGECLNPAGVRLLERLGLLDSVATAGAVPMRGWDLALREAPPAAGRFARGDRALGIERSTLDRVLIEAARDAGVLVREGVRAIDAEAGSGDRPASARLRLPDGTEQRRACRLLVGADGLHSRVARAAGVAREVRRPRKASLSWHVEGRGPSRDRGRLVLGRGLTGGLAPVGRADGARWNATLVLTTGARAASGPPPELGWRTMLDLLLEAPGGSGGWEDTPRVVEGPWGSGSFHRPVRGPATGRLMLAGDAAGYFDPLTGQGIYRALKSADLAAAAVHRHLCVEGQWTPAPDDPAASAKYARELRRTQAPGRWLQRSIEAVVARGGPRRVALGVLRRSPALTSALVRCAGDRPTTMLGRAPRRVATAARSATRTGFSQEHDANH